MTDQLDVGSKIMLQRMDELSSQMREMRGVQNETNKQSREDSIKIERVLAEVKSISSVTDQVKTLESIVDRHEIRLSLMDQACKDESERKLPERVAKLEGTQMKMVGALAVVVVIWQGLQFLFKVMS
jgi:hypothetical protein